MTLVRNRTRSALSAAATIAGVVWLTAACGGETSPDASAGTSPGGATSPSDITWNEPASYVYTLTANEQALAGSFRVTVRDGKVTEAVGLDDSGREVVEQGLDRIPKIGDLLDRWENARNEHADTAEVEHAADGHPSRITLDGDENSIDDEAEYVISSYEPAAG
ncbi:MULTISPECIES: DUF6174 domain-containing protein [unclassified Streptomyces]|uniref:DUF6174 domain-containing protein n=1 Tax=unclassified Streptomyces TaxID=2593676 RepID=UPI002DDA7481|nr:DUF6174 domain-containing protein [Streptomyces sp. NBC_00243]WRZ22362.1 DUF6174 domain-containing protein [Streptomyces sp. NBC_00243]